MMLKFFKHIFLFCLPIALILYPLDLWLSKNLAKSNRYPGNYSAWNDIYAGNINADMLIYGSSRATHHIDPDILSDSLNIPVYNFGVNGHGFWIQYLKHLEYLKNNPYPKHIILIADWFTLEKRKDLYQYNQFIPYMLWNKNIREYTRSYEGFNVLDYYIPLARYYGNTNAKEWALIYAFKPDSLKPYKKKGYKPLANNRHKDLISNLKLKMNSYHVIIDSSTVKLIDDFLIECKKNNVQVTFVYTPEYIEGQKFIDNRKEAIEIFQNLAEKHDLKYLDYSNDSICFKKEYFDLTMHLNKSGAELFTRRLAQDLVLKR